MNSVGSKVAQSVYKISFRQQFYILYTHLSLNINASSYPPFNLNNFNKITYLKNIQKLQQTLLISKASVFSQNANAKDATDLSGRGLVRFQDALLHNLPQVRILHGSSHSLLVIYLLIDCNTVKEHPEKSHLLFLLSMWLYKQNYIYLQEFTEKTWGSSLT